MPAHNAHHLPAFRREAAPVRDTAEVDGQSGFVHRCAGRLCSIDAAPCAAAAAAGATIERPLLGAGTKRAVDARLDAASTHLPQRRPEAQSGVIIERFEAAA